MLELYHLPYLIVCLFSSVFTFLTILKDKASKKLNVFLFLKLYSHEPLCF